jgi:hypothetical protein
LEGLVGMLANSWHPNGETSKNHGIEWKFIHGIYPLVNIQKAIEHGHL